MPIINQFDPPALQNDLTDPTQEAKFRDEWSNSLNRWTETALLGNPWTVLNDQNRDYYYNPLTTDSGGAQQSAQITWVAFPNRILFFFSNATFNQQMAYADGGPHVEDGSYGPPPNVNGQPYSPPGPRGWQDEYCESNTRRDANGKVTRVDFTCENPEYWFTLWRVSPETVLDWYHQLVDPSVQLTDLYLLDENNQPVIDRETGLPAYNPTNKWNNQLSAGATTGAVHLISPPNTLGAEIYLAAAATILRDNPPGTPITDPEALIQCAQYGRANRNSDPHIGATVNGAILNGAQSTPVKLSLQNPVGLYIQMPDFSSYELPSDPKLPAGAQPSDCWQIIRGKETIEGFTPNFNFILHARFELPQSWVDAGVSFTVGDITIQGNPIQYGAQLTQTFQIGLNGLVIVPPGLPAEQPQSCVEPNPNPLPNPQQLQDFDLFQAQSTSAAVTKVEQGQMTPDIVLLAQFADQNSTITFPEGGVNAEVTNFQTFTSGGQTFQLYTLSLSVDGNAALGDRSLLLTNPDGTQGPAAPGMLSVVPPGSLGKGAGTKAASPQAASPRAASRGPRKLDTSKINLPKQRY